MRELYPNLESCCSRRFILRFVEGGLPDIVCDECFFQGVDRDLSYLPPLDIMSCLFCFFMNKSLGLDYE